jgi:hypothetical protein
MRRAAAMRIELLERGGAHQVDQHGGRELDVLGRRVCLGVWLSPPASGANASATATREARCWASWPAP